MDKISVDPPNSNDTNPSNRTQTGNLFGIIGETLRTRLYDAFLKPPTFIHSPPQPPSNDHRRSSSGSRRQDRGDLNYPFAPISPSIRSTETDSTSQMIPDEVTILEDKISNLEDSMKNILIQEDSSSPPQESPPPSLPDEQVIVTGDIQIVGVVPYEEMDKLLLPPLSRMKDKMPPSIYQELLAIYESQLLMTGGGIPDLNSKVDVNVSRSTTSQTSGQEGEKKQGGNKEKNVRSEVLKWNKD